MGTTQQLINEVYAAFNRRDVDGVLEKMSDDVSWPKASEGGRVVGKDEIRAYWTRQWASFDPYVQPLEVVEREPGEVAVRVRQVLKSLAGELLSDSEVWHVYALANGVVKRMDLGRSEGDSEQSPTSAFTKH